MHFITHNYTYAFYFIPEKMNNNLLVPALLLLSLFATSSAYLDGAREESCYDHSIIHTVDLGGGEVINDPSTVCNTPCGYQLYVVGERAENGTLIEYETSTTTSFEYKLNTTYQCEFFIVYNRTALIKVYMCACVMYMPPFSTSPPPHIYT